MTFHDLVKAIEARREPSIESHSEFLLTAKELGQLLGVSERTIYRWYNSGKIPGIHLPRYLRFQPESVYRYLVKTYGNDAQSAFIDKETKENCNAGLKQRSDAIRKNRASKSTDSAETQRQHGSEPAREPAVS